MRRKCINRFSSGVKLRTLPLSVNPSPAFLGSVLELRSLYASLDSQLHEIRRYLKYVDANQSNLLDIFQKSRLLVVRRLILIALLLLMLVVLVGLLAFN